MNTGRLESGIENLIAKIDNIVDKSQPSEECQNHFNQEDNKRVGWSAFIIQNTVYLAIIGFFTVWMIMQPSSIDIDTKIKSEIQGSFAQKITILQEKQKSQEKLNEGWLEFSKKIDELIIQVTEVKKDVIYLKLKSK